MSRTLGVCWIFLWISAAANVSANYVLSNEYITWNDAKNKDNFATPRIQANTSPFTVDVTVNLKNEEPWVGYYMKETAFAYIGCVRIYNTNPNFILPVRNNTPGLCYSMCDKSDKKYVGLNSGKCFCMSEKPREDMSLTVCDISNNHDWIAGGGEEYMSIYERIKSDIFPQESQGAKKCLVYEHNVGHSWEQCIVYLKALCKSGASVNDFGYCVWAKYVKLCFQNKTYSVTYNDTNNLSQTTGPHWTNVIRSDVIYKYNEVSHSISQENVKRYGYIAKKGQMAVLSFTKDGNTVRHFLQSLPVTKPTSDKVWTLTTSQVPESITKTSNVYLSSKIFTQDTRTTPTYGETTSATTKKRSTQISASSKATFSEINDTFVKSTEGFKSVMNVSGSDVSIPVSVSVVATILVAVVVVVIVTLKRRGKFKEICTKITAPDNTSESKAETILAEKNVYVESPISDYEQISELQDNNNVDVKPDLDVENGDYGHTYFVLEPGSRESHTDGDISDSRKEETEMNDDYNTLHSNKTFGTKADDTYDTTEKAAIKLKELRDTGYEKEFPEKRNKNEEDTYNHISKNLLKNNKTDNIYGVPVNHDNDYGDVNNGCKKNPHDGDDTYSHLNTTH